MYHHFKEPRRRRHHRRAHGVARPVILMGGNPWWMAETANPLPRYFWALAKLQAGFPRQPPRGNLLSILLVFGNAWGCRQSCGGLMQRPGRRSTNSAQFAGAERAMLAPSSVPTGEFPYEIHRDLPEFMQSLVGIFRTEEDCRTPSANWKRLERAWLGSRRRSRMFNPAAPYQRCARDGGCRRSGHPQRAGPPRKPW